MYDISTFMKRNNFIGTYLATKPFVYRIVSKNAVVWISPHFSGTTCILQHFAD